MGKWYATLPAADFHFSCFRHLLLLQFESQVSPKVNVLKAWSIVATEFRGKTLKENPFFPALFICWLMHV